MASPENGEGMTNIWTWGVIKLFDDKGQLVDATPYFGGSVSFSRAQQSYTLSRIAIALPDGRLHELTAPRRMLEKLDSVRIPRLYFDTP